MTAPVPTMEAVLPEDQRFVAIRRRQGWVLAAVAVIGLALATGGMDRLGLVGPALAFAVLAPALIWSNVIDFRLGSNRRRLRNDPPSFLVRADGTVGFGFAGSRQRDLRSSRELVHVELGAVTGAGVGDGFPVRAPYSGLFGAFSGLAKAPGSTWAQAVDGPALWLCFPERDWLLCTPRAAELVAYLSTLGPLPGNTRPPVPAPTPLRQGRWTAAPTTARPVTGSTEWSGVAVPLPGGPQLLVGLDGRTAIGSSPTDLGTEWRDADELLLVELGEVSGSTQADGWSSPRGPVGVQDGPALWLCFPDQDWLLCSERVMEVLAVLAADRSLPWATSAATRPVVSPTALRGGRWTPSGVQVERTS